MTYREVIVMNVLLAGGAGYIGSHTAVELLSAGHDVVIVDDYSNSSPEVISRIEQISGKSVKAYEADVKDKAADVIEDVKEKAEDFAAEAAAKVETVANEVSEKVEEIINGEDAQ
jgi:UDP-glucose 4-epimerase